MTAYKLVTVLCKIWGFQGRLEKNIHKVFLSSLSLSSSLFLSLPLPLLSLLLLSLSLFFSLS